MSYPKTYPKPAPPPREFIFPLRYGYSLTLCGAGEGDGFVMFYLDGPGRLRLGPFFADAEQAQNIGRELEWQGRAADGTLPEPEKYQGRFDADDEYERAALWAEPVGVDDNFFKPGSLAAALYDVAKSRLDANGIDD